MDSNGASILGQQTRRIRRSRGGSNPRALAIEFGDWQSGGEWRRAVTALLLWAMLAIECGGGAKVAESKQID